MSWSAVFENPVRPWVAARRAAHEEYSRVTDPAWSDFKAGKISLTEWRSIKSAAEAELRRRLKEAEARSA